MKCSIHPKVETNLRCSKCGTPICPRCLVQTPVGARCPECAKLSKLPIYQIPATHYLRAAGTGLGMAIICGIVWAVLGGFLVQVIHLNFNLLLAPGVGYTIGEVISRSVNRKRGIGLATIAGVAVVVSYLVKIMIPVPFLWGLPLSLFNIVIDLVAIALGVFIAVRRLR